MLNNLMVLSSFSNLYNLLMILKNQSDPGKSTPSFPLKKVPEGAEELWSDHLPNIFDCACKLVYFVVILKQVDKKL